MPSLRQEPGPREAPPAHWRCSEKPRKMEAHARGTLGTARPRPDGRDAFPWELVEKGSKLGFNTLAVPKKYGGAGASVLTQCLVMEELSAGEAAVSKVYSHNWKAIAGIMSMASEEQILRVTKDFV